MDASNKYDSPLKKTKTRWEIGDSSHIEMHEPFLKNRVN